MPSTELSQGKVSLAATELHYHLFLTELATAYIEATDGLATHNSFLCAANPSTMIGLFYTHLKVHKVSAGIMEHLRVNGYYYTQEATI